MRYKVSVSFTKFSILAFLLCAGAVIAPSACSHKDEKAFKTVEQYLKNNGARDVKLDLFYTDQKFADKAYISVTVTYNFATSEGKLQEEYLGYILKQSGDAWKIETHTQYTKEKDKALDILSGKSIT